MTEKRIATGYADKRFRPEELVTREAFAAFMYRLAGWPSVSLPAKSPFKDVPKDSQFYKPIVWMAATGLSTGWEDGTFRPRWNITRDAMAAFLYRYEDKPSVTLPAKSRFSDVPTSAQYYKEVTWLSKSGMTTGFSDGTF
ncbi:S-layer homology domain-containing protein, partial [Demequina oxidasica]|uniref:S-layer homology domain-containing protein n=1 Tax=Demequina oxidasica TaxID=676199 RepID=UPI001F1C0D0E